MIEARAKYTLLLGVWRRVNDCGLCTVLRKLGQKSEGGPKSDFPPVVKVPRNRPLAFLQLHENQRGGGPEGQG